MDDKTRKLFDARSAVLKAMAHPTRLFILDQLATGEQCVAELTKMVDVDMSTVSKHLNVLKGAGLVDIDKRGSQVFYSLRTPCIMNFFGCLESVLEHNARIQLAVTNLK